MLVMAVAALCGCATMDVRTDQRTCEVHGTPMYNDTVSVTRRPGRMPAGYEGARRRLFPNAWATVMAEGKGEGFAKVRYCPTCREEEVAWKAAHAGAGTPAGRGPAGSLPPRGTDPLGDDMQGMP
jgi:hypothetical protein